MRTFFYLHPTLLGVPLLCACLGKTQVASKVVAVTPALPTASARVLAVAKTELGVELETTAGILSISTPLADTFRVRLLRARTARPLPDFAVDSQALPPPLKPVVEESQTMLLVRSAGSMLRIDKDPLRVRLLDGAGHVLAEDAVSVAWRGAGVELGFALAADERVFGLGDKLRGFDRRGQSFELWNTDAFGFKTDADPLYKSIPFWLQLAAGRAHGVFVNLPSRAAVDVGVKQPESIRYDAKLGDAFDVYLFAGPDPKRVISQYTELTGRTPLPPLWALGHHQSRYGYLSEAEVRGVVTRMQQEKLPLDAVWLDIDYQDKNAPFTVNSKAFPTFAKMVSDLKARGVSTVVITDLHVKSYQRAPSAGYLPYDSGAAGDHFIHGAAGFFEGPVWPGASVFPEFTRAQTRAWWGGLYQDFVAQGVAGFWNDMNEPAVFVKDKTFPEDVQHRLDDERQVSHAWVHNVYGTLNARATYEGVKQLRPEVRPFVLTRAAYAGAQRYAASWTGDNTADRSHLAATIPQLLNLGVSGYPFNGADVGGFVGCPDAELFAEWMELGSLQPFFRNHSAKEACRREPWLFGAAIQARAKRAVERRYRLLPYLYTLFQESSLTGAPIMRPLWLEYPNDVATYGVDNAYLLGRDLLVAPRLVPGAARYRVVLPAADWYDTETLDLVSGGAHEVEAKAGDSVRLFARAGAIIPEAPVVPSTRESPHGPLTLTVWPGQDCSGSLYVDDGESFAYQNGASRTWTFNCDTATDGLSLRANAVGKADEWWHEVRLVLHAVPRAPQSVADGSGNALPHVYDPAKKTLVVTVAQPPGDYAVRARW